MTREEYEMVVQHATEFGRATVGVVGAKTQLLAHDASQRALIEQQAREIERLKDLNEHLKIEAQGHAQEAKTANATIAEIYQCVSGATGEVGSWHGAQPVRDAMDKQAQEIAFHVSRVEALRRFLSEKITECQKQAKEIAQLQINHTDINVEFDRLNGVITRQMEDIERLTELATGYHDTAENRTNDIEQQAREIARLRGTLERISRHVPIMGSTGDYRQGQLDVLESVKRIAEEHP